MTDIGQRQHRHQTQQLQDQEDGIPHCTASPRLRADHQCFHLGKSGDVKFRKSGEIQYNSTSKMFEVFCGW